MSAYSARREMTIDELTIASRAYLNVIHSRCTNIFKLSGFSHENIVTDIARHVQLYNNKLKTCVHLAENANPFYQARPEFDEVAIANRLLFMENVDRTARASAIRGFLLSE